MSFSQKWADDHNAKMALAKANKFTAARHSRGSDGVAGFEPDNTSTAGSTPAAAPILRIVILGQIRGGKNNMIVTRTGLHFPKPEWAKWRNEAVQRVKEQIPASFKIITNPVNVRLDYWAGDKRRRDFPAICDAIWHVLEKAGVVSDDTFLWPSVSSRGFDKLNPRCELTFK